MKYTILAILFFCIFILAYPDGMIGYAYDSAGNRIKREIIISRSVEPKGKSTEEKFYDSVDSETVYLSYKTNGVLGIGVPSFGEGDSGNIEVHSLGGALVFTQVLSGTEAIVDLCAQPDGIYILTVTINGNRTSWKITVQ